MKVALTENSKGRFAHYVIVLVIALYGMSQKNYVYDEVTIFENFMIELVGFGQSKTTSVKQSVSSFFDHYIFIVNTSKENKKLRISVDKLEDQIFQLSEVQKENGRLKQLLKFGKELKIEKVLAQVVSMDSNNKHVFRINKGSVDGIRERAPVITLNGLVGYIYRVTKNYADVLTILDQNNRVDSIVSRTRSHGIVEGLSTDKCRMKYVVRTEDVKDGDQIITAGLGDMYPKGIKVGTISKVEKESYGITQYIEVTPTVDFHRLEEVAVLTKITEQDIAPAQVEAIDEAKN
ncbi:rod shape-determining protein MreC [Bacteriovoracaceae bacterium]|nr:rod shape-determining protein MreC [Bacteriovoracaceae bacterium]